MIPNYFTFRSDIQEEKGKDQKKTHVKASWKDNINIKSKQSFV